jgi:hypothetical protein
MSESAVTWSSARRWTSAASRSGSPRNVGFRSGWASSCWSFQATWLFRTPTLAALEPEDIQPNAELRLARRARNVLDGTPEGLALARRLGVRYLLVDPTCTDTRSRPIDPPAVGTPVFVSKRLVVLRLPAA